VLGGLGIGSVWGWLLVVAAAPVANRFVPTGLGLAVGSLLLGASIYWLAGSEGVAGFMVASFVGAVTCFVTRAELHRIRLIHGTGGRS